MLKILTLLIVLVTVGCGGSQEVVIPENPNPLPPEDVMEIGGGGGGGAGSVTTDGASPPPLPARGQ